MKISDCRAFSPFKTLPGCRAFRHNVLESPSAFSSALLPPFYKAVFDAWRSLGGSYDPSFGASTYSIDSNSRILLSGITCKLAYLRPLEINAVVSHCVEKFSPSSGGLYWPAIGFSFLYAP